MKTGFRMDGVFGSPYTDEDKERIKRTYEENPDILYAAFIQYADGQYRFLLTEVTERDG
jgi:hypothetical protein